MESFSPVSHGLKARKLFMGGNTRKSSKGPGSPRKAAQFQSFSDTAMKLSEVSSQHFPSQGVHEKSEITFSNVNFPRQGPPAMYSSPLKTIGLEDAVPMISDYVPYKFDSGYKEYSAQPNNTNIPSSIQTSFPLGLSSIVQGVTTNQQGLGESLDFKSYTQLEEELKSQKTKVEMIQKECESKDSIILSMSKQIEELNGKQGILDEAQKMLVLLKKRIEDLEKEKETAKHLKESEIRYLNSEIMRKLEEMAREKDQKENEILLLRQEKEMIVAEMRKKDEENQKLSQKIDILDFEKSQGALDKNRVTRENKIYEQELESMKEKNSRMEKTSSNMGPSKVGMLEAKVQSLKNELKRKDKLITELQDEKIRSLEVQGTEGVKNRGGSLEKQNEQLREEVKVSQERVNRLMSELRAKENEIYKMRKEKIQFEEETDGKVTAFEVMQNENARLLGVVKQMQEAIKKQEVMLDETGTREQKWGSISGLNDELRKRVSLLEEDNTKLQMELESLEQRFITNQEITKQKMIEVSSLERDNDNLKEDLERMSIRLESSEKQNKALKEKILILESEETRFLSNEELFEHDLKSTAARCIELEDQVRIWKEKLEEAEGEISLKRDLELKVEALIEENLRLRDDFKFSSERMANFQSKVEELGPLEDAAGQMKRKIMEQYEDLMALSQDRENLIRRVEDLERARQESYVIFENKLRDLELKLGEEKAEKQHMSIQLQNAKIKEGDMHQIRMEQLEKTRIIGELEQKLNVLSREHLSLNQSVGKSASEVKSYQEVIEDLEKENGFLRHEIDLLNGKTQVLENGLMSKETERQEEQIQLEEKVSIVLDENYKLERKITELEQDKQKMIKYTSECEIYMNKCEEYLRDLETVERTKDQLLRERENLLSENDRLKRANEELEMALVKREDDVSQLVEELRLTEQGSRRHEDLVRGIEVLREDKQRLMEMVNRQKNELEEMRRGRRGQSGSRF